LYRGSPAADLLQGSFFHTLFEGPECLFEESKGTFSLEAVPKKREKNQIK
jgi:hypothetical protein